MADRPKKNLGFLTSYRQHIKNRVQRGKKSVRKKSPNPHVDNFVYFQLSLKSQEHAISALLKLTHEALIASQEAAKTLEDNYEISIDTKLQAEHEREAHEDAANIFAGSIFVILNNLLFPFALRLKTKSETYQFNAGRKIGGACLLQLIRVAANNFRHYEEWTTKTSKTNPSIKILRSAKISAPWNRNLCAEVLQKIGWESTNDLMREIRKLGSEILNVETSIPL